MTFEIWQTAPTGVAALLCPLREVDRLAFEQHGFRQLRTIEADSVEAAQDRFAEWCRLVCPGAREQEAEPHVVRQELLQALG